MSDGNPVQRRFGRWPACRRVSTTCRRVICAAQLGDVAGLVLYDLLASDEVRVSKANLAPGRKSEELLRRIFTKIILLDIEHATEWHLTGTGIRIFRIVDGIELFA